MNFLVKTLALLLVAKMPVALMPIVAQMPLS
jgi:hypothetical protein